MKKKLIELTPKKYMCDGVSPFCPGVFASENGSYVIIGKTLNSELDENLKGRVGAGETAIEISAELVNQAISTLRK